MGGLGGLHLEKEGGGRGGVRGEKGGGRREKGGGRRGRVRDVERRRNEEGRRNTLRE